MFSCAGYLFFLLTNITVKYIKNQGRRGDCGLLTRLWILAAFPFFSSFSERSNILFVRFCYILIKFCRAHKVFHGMHLKYIYCSVKVMSKLLNFLLHFKSILQKYVLCQLAINNVTSNFFLVHAENIKPWW